MCEQENTIPVKQVAGLLETIQHRYIESELYSIVIIGKIIGKSYDEITGILKGFEFQNDCSRVKPERFILEIRREKCTVSCVFVNFFAPMLMFSTTDTTRNDSQNVYISGLL